MTDATTSRRARVTVVNNSHVLMMYNHNGIIMSALFYVVHVLTVLVYCLLGTPLLYFVIC